MKFEELLKQQGLNEEQVKAVTTAMTKEKIYLSNEENIDERYTKLKGTKEDLEKELKTANDTITDLKKSNKDNDELQKKVTDYEAEIDTLKKDSAAKIKNLTLDSAISNLLTKNNAKYGDLLSTKFDRDKLVVNEDGSVSGLKEQFEGIKEEYKDMFGEESNPNPGQVYTPVGGEMKPPSGATSFVDIIKENQAKK